MSSVHETSQEEVSEVAADPAATNTQGIGSGLLASRPAGAMPALTPAAVLALQRGAGNRAVRRWLARTPTAAKSRFTAKATDLENIRAKLQEVAQAVDYRTRMTLMGDKTLVVGLVVDGDGEPHLVYTVSNNWINPELRAAAEKAGLTRWEATPRTEGRGDVGAPGDAEQLMLEAAHTNGFRVAAMAVSRVVCKDCNEAIKDYDEGPIQVVVERIVASEADQAITAKLNKLRDYYERLSKQVELSEGEHKAQLDLINTPSFKGFMGYWTNELFNKQPPQLAIWNNAHGRLVAAKREINAGRPEGALHELLLAHRQYLVALKWFIAWKSGLPGAGAKMQVAIGLTAVAIIVAFVAPSVVARAAGGASGAAGAATGAAEEQMVARIVQVVEKADAAIAASETAVTEAELLALPEVAQEAEILQTMAL